MTSDDTVLHTVSPLVKAFMILLPFAVFGGLLWASLESGAGPAAALGRFGPFWIIGSLIAFMNYRVAHTIVLHGTAATVEFRTFLGTRVVPARDITSISHSFFQRGLLVVRHAGGSATIPAQFEGCHDLLRWVRKHSPHVAFKGI